MYVHIEKFLKDDIVVTSACFFITVSGSFLIKCAVMNFSNMYSISIRVPIGIMKDLNKYRNYL